MSSWLMIQTNRDEPKSKQYIPFIDEAILLVLVHTLVDNIPDKLTNMFQTVDVVERLLDQTWNAGALVLGSRSDHDFVLHPLLDLLERFEGYPDRNQILRLNLAKGQLLHRTLGIPTVCQIYVDIVHEMAITAKKFHHVQATVDLFNACQRRR